MALSLEIKIHYKTSSIKTYAPSVFDWDANYMLSSLPFQPCEDFALDYTLSLSSKECLELINQLLKQNTIHEDKQHTINRLKKRLNDGSKIDSVEFYIYEWESGLG